MENLWDCFHSTLFSVINKFVPKNKSVSGSRTHYPAHILKLQSRKNILWKKWRTSKLDPDRLRYLDISKQCRQAIHEFTLKKESDLVDSSNPGGFYKYVNRKLSSKSGIGVLKNDRGESICDPADQAEVLNKFFASAFTDDDGLVPPFPPRVPADSGLNFVPFSSNDVFKKLSRLKSKSAAGSDGLPPVFLKHIAAEIASPLAFIFEQFFSGAFVPPIWKEAYIRPIFKGGSACDPANYRPISLTCVCSKIMESIISEHMLSFLLAHNLITKHQHGFLVKRSTCTQLLEYFQDWVVSLNNKQSVDVVYIDFSRAFDSVVYSELLIKLESYGFRYDLLAWLKSFLVDRYQRVVIDGFFSDFCRVCSGVPQGTVLAPLLFLLYINDIVDFLDSNSVNYLLMTSNSIQILNFLVQSILISIH